MGVDWVRMKLRPGVDPAEVARLSEACHRRNVRDWIPKELIDEADRLPWTEPRPKERSAFDEHWEALKGLLELPPAFPRYFDMEAITGDMAPGDPAVRSAEMIRVYVVTANPAFPAEWRRAAFETILPDELEGRLTCWSEYIDAVRRGEFRGYLHELFLALNRRESNLAEVLAGLRSAVADSFERTNAWAHKTKFLEVRERLLADPMLSESETLLPDRGRLPEFDPSRRGESVDPGEVEAHESLAAVHRRAADLVQSWNGCMPQSRKLSLPQPPYRDFDAFLAWADDRWLDSFFAWCGHLVEEGDGLLLWG